MKAALQRTWLKPSDMFYSFTKCWARGDRIIWENSLHMSVRCKHWEGQNCFIWKQILSQVIMGSVLRGKTRLCTMGKLSWQGERCGYKTIWGKGGKSLTGWDAALRLGKPRRNLWGAIFPRLRDVRVHMLFWLKFIGLRSVYLLDLSSSSVLCLWAPSVLQPTEVEAKSRTRFNWDSWLCLDTSRPPILFSAYTLPSSFGETPNPKSDTLL